MFPVQASWVAYGSPCAPALLADNTAQDNVINYNVITAFHSLHSMVQRLTRDWRELLFLAKYKRALTTMALCMVKRKCYIVLVNPVIYIQVTFRLPSL